MRKQNPVDILSIASVAGIDAAIDMLGAKAQGEMIHSMELPSIGSIETLYGAVESINRAIFEGWGIVFGDKTDKLFVAATIPDGWKKHQTSHYMWSYLQDDKGQNRAYIMYKPDCWDMDASISPLKKYSYTTSYFHEDDEGHTPDFTRMKVVVKDSNDTIIWESEYYKIDKLNPLASKTIGQVGIDWLNIHYPDWQDYNAYW
jgi:hypothetical protein